MTARRPGWRATRARWGAGCAFLDYDRDGKLDLFAANYIDLDLATAPVPESGLCRYKGLPVACGPPGLPGGKNVLYRNRGDGTFEDVSDARRASPRAQRHLRPRRQHARLRRRRVGRSVCRERLESERAVPQQSRRHLHGHRASPPAAPTARTASRRPAWASPSATTTATGTMDIFKTNFAGDTSTLYANTGNGLCEDRTFASGFGRNTRWLGWGVGVPRPRSTTAGSISSS